jgi:hypothetical protein
MQQQHCPHCHAETGPDDRRCSRCDTQLSAAEPARGRTPARVKVLIGIAAGVVALAAVVVVPALLNRPGQQARAVAGPLVTPNAILGLPRNYLPEVLRGDQRTLGQLAGSGFGNGVSATYGADPSDRLLSVTAVRVEDGADLDGFRKGQLDVLAGRYPGRRTSVTREGLALDCGDVTAGTGEVRSWCIWNDGDTAGVAIGSGHLDAARVATLAAAGRAAITGHPMTVPPGAAGAAGENAAARTRIRQSPPCNLTGGMQQQATTGQAGQARAAGATGGQPATG